MLTHLQNKLNALKAFSFENELKEIIEDNKDKLADLQAAQLFTGLDSRGNKLTLNRHGEVFDTYAAFTIQKKIESGEPYDRITWRQSGFFYKSLKAEIKGSKFSINSNSFKFDKLKARSGTVALGLNVDSRRDFITEITRPKILEAYEEKVTSV